MNIKNMEKALQVLLDIQKDKKKLKKFNLNTWGELPGKNKRKSVPELKCATQACALGSIALSGVIKGLTWVPEDNYRYHHTNKAIEFMPVYKSGDDLLYENFEAAQGAFDIDEDLSRWLFDPDNYNVKSGDKALATVIARMQLAIDAEKQGVSINIDGDFIP